MQTYLETFWDRISEDFLKTQTQALMHKELLTFDEADTPSFQDPLFEYWVRKYYFEVAE